MANISMSTIDTINLKLSQAYAVTSLLTDDCGSHTPINDKLRADALSAVSDLIADSKAIFRAETESKGGNKKGVNND